MLPDMDNFTSVNQNTQNDLLKTTLSDSNQKDSQSLVDVFGSNNDLSNVFSSNQPSVFDNTSQNQFDSIISQFDQPPQMPMLLQNQSNYLNNFASPQQNIINNVIQQPRPNNNFNQTNDPLSSLFGNTNDFKAYTSQGQSQNQNQNQHQHQQIGNNPFM